MLNSEEHREARKKHQKKYRQSEKSKETRKKYFQSERGKEIRRAINKRYQHNFEVGVGVPWGTMQNWANPEAKYLRQRRYADKIIELYGVSKTTLRNQGVTKPLTGGQNANR